jgi:hypothetical protein
MVVAAYNDAESHGGAPCQETWLARVGAKAALFSNGQFGEGLEVFITRVRFRCREKIFGTSKSTCLHRSPRVRCCSRVVVFAFLLRTLRPPTRSHVEKSAAQHFLHAAALFRRAAECDIFLPDKWQRVGNVHTTNTLVL